MKNSNITPTAHRDADTLQARFALRVTSRLSESAARTPHDVQQRLRFAREQALARAHAARSAATPRGVRGLGGGTLAFVGGPDPSPWWTGLASLLPLVVLVAGLVLIQERHAQAQIEAAAEIDTALLTDALPPLAYSDPGFAEYLSNPIE